MYTVKALITALLISTSAADENPLYRWLSTAELETLLRGSWITQPDRRVSYMRNPEEFHENGSYVLHGDNYEAHGKYSFRDNAVCDQAERNPEVCRRVLIDKHGQYWIVGRYNPRLVERISVQPLQ